jgi:hypothetical protein
MNRINIDPAYVKTYGTLPTLDRKLVEYGLTEYRHIVVPVFVSGAYRFTAVFLGVMNDPDANFQYIMGKGFMVIS